MRVLVVEDDEALARLVRSTLEREGYAVDVAGSGDDALWRGTEFTYDLIVLDRQMPPPDGLAVCRGLRAAGSTVPVLMLTGLGASGDIVDGLDAGADDYLVKPFERSELLARLRALTRRPADVRQPVLEVGDLRLDPAAHVVRSGDQEIPLTPKEFALLHLFMSHPEEVITRTRVIDTVWSGDYDGFSNVVDVHVRALRQKIGAERLETVRGVGYRLRTRG